MELINKNPIQKFRKTPINPFPPKAYYLLFQVLQVFSDFLYQSQLGVINHKIITAITARKILINVCKELEETTVMKSLKGLAAAKMITWLCRQFCWWQV